MYIGKYTQQKRRPKLHKHTILKCFFTTKKFTTFLLAFFTFQKINLSISRRPVTVFRQPRAHFEIQYWNNLINVIEPGKFALAGRVRKLVILIVEINDYWRERSEVSCASLWMHACLWRHNWLMRERIYAGFRGERLLGFIAKFFIESLGILVGSLSCISVIST